MPLRLRPSFGDTSLASYTLPKSVFIPPEATYRVAVNVEETGDDRLQPIALHIQRRIDITDLV